MLHPAHVRSGKAKVRVSAGRCNGNIGETLGRKDVTGRFSDKKQPGGWVGQAVSPAEWHFKQAPDATIAPV
jgi:hypothetical protein